MAFTEGLEDTTFTCRYFFLKGGLISEGIFLFMDRDFVIYFENTLRVSNLFINFKTNSTWRIQ